jgi:hypothetical protein
MTRELQFWSWIWCYKEDMSREFKMVFLRFGRIHMCTVHCMAHCTSEFINALEIPAKVVVLFYPVLRLPKEHCFLEGFQAASICPGKSNMQMKESMKQWCYGTDRGNRNAGRKTSPIVICPPHISHGLIWGWIAPAWGRLTSVWITFKYPVSTAQ